MIFRAIGCRGTVYEDVLWRDRMLFDFVAQDDIAIM